MYLMLLTFILSTLNTWIPYIIDTVLANLYSQTKREIALKEEEYRLKYALTSIAMVDEFAKYARTQRELIKIQQELKTAISDRQSAHMKTQLILTYSFQGLVTLLVLITVWMNKYEPVIVLPAHWLKPLEYVISWPTGIAGGVSIMLWISIMEASIRVTTTNVKRLLR